LKLELKSLKKVVKMISNPVLSKFGIGMLPSSSPAWKSFEGKSFASFLAGYEPEVPIPAFTMF